MTLHFDCFAGISGDMTLGALVDLGVSADELRYELQKLDIAKWSLDFVREERCGIYGLRAIVKEDESFSAESSRHNHRHWSEIRGIIEKSLLRENAKKTALAVFSRIAAAEAEVHNSSIEDVAFHEVGAVDSIIDIVGVAICLDIIKPDKITSSEIELGGGTLLCAHGVLPVPAPATLALCRGLPVHSGGFNNEMTTPTGAAILAECVNEFISAASWREIKTGCGIGGRRLEKPNILRASLRDEVLHHAGPRDAGPVSEELFMLETNIDDMTGEELGFLMEALFKNGALDVTFTPCVMKKSRPAHIISALCRAEKKEALCAEIFKKSSAIGLRETKVRRLALAREEKPIKDCSVKKTFFEGRVKEKIEYEDRARTARENDISLAEAGALLRANNA